MVDAIKRTIKLRPTHNGNRLKPEVITLDGQTHLFYRGWVCNVDDLYPGEIAWIFCQPDMPILWIAEGDLAPDAAW